LDILEFIIGADRGAERAENRVEWSGVGVAEKWWSGAWRGTSQSKNGAGSRAWSVEREVAERERSGA